MARDPAQPPAPAVAVPTPPTLEPDPRRFHVEANRLHRALFGSDAPEEVQRQFASAFGDGRLAKVPHGDLSRLIERAVDLEAIELALRRRTPANALTQRFHVLCYLVEARAEYFDRFIGETAHPVAAALTLSLHAVRSLYKLVKGRCLLWLHHGDVG